MKVPHKPATAKELAAIDAVKAAIKALPKNIHMGIDDSDGVVEFWKSHSPCSSHRVSTPLRRKQAFNNSFRWR